MGIDTTAWLAYGIQIPNTHAEDLEAKLKDTVGVGYLHAGPYDREKTYLVTACHSADLGTPKTVDLGDAYTDGDPTGRWDAMLGHAVEKVGAGRLTHPGWLLIAAQS